MRDGGYNAHLLGCPPSPQPPLSLGIALFTYKRVGPHRRGCLVWHNTSVAIAQCYIYKWPERLPPIKGPWYKKYPKSHLLRTTWASATQDTVLSAAQCKLKPSTSAQPWHHSAPGKQTLLHTSCLTLQTKDDCIALPEGLHCCWNCRQPLFGVWGRLGKALR